VVNELQKGPRADQGFMESLAAVMLEQTFRLPAVGAEHRGARRADLVRSWLSRRPDLRRVHRRREPDEDNHLVAAGIGLQSAPANSRLEMPVRVKS
jgi:hypothetical protein